VSGESCAACRAKGRTRASAARRGYDSRWRRYRIRQWLPLHPRCGDRLAGQSAEHSQCRRDGRDVPGTDVDHIVPVSGPDDPLFWEVTNHQSLCHACHSAKTAREDGGFGRDAAAAGAAASVGPRRTMAGVVLL
jgi:5-methylcytosine-specific restriction protein A